jgi:hypothetical protein
LSPDPFDEPRFVMSFTLGKKKKMLFLGVVYEKVVQVKKWPVTEKQAREILQMIPDRLKAEEELKG